MGHATLVKAAWKDWRRLDRWLRSQSRHQEQIQPARRPMSTIMAAIPPTARPVPAEVPAPAKASASAVTNHFHGGPFDGQAHAGCEIISPGATTGGWTITIDFPHSVGGALSWGAYTLRPATAMRRSEKNISATYKNGAPGHWHYIPTEHEAAASPER